MTDPHITRPTGNRYGPTLGSLPGGLLGGLALLITVLALGALLLPETSGLIDHLRATQLAVHDRLSAAVQAAQSDPGAGLWLIALSFVYGLLHAAGPGHGKVVIATYLGAGSASLRRGITLSCAAAALQGLTAIVLVVVATSVLELGFRDTRGSARGFEIASYAMVTLLGLWLVARSLKPLIAALRSGGAVPKDHHHGQKHHHGQDHQHGHQHGTDSSCDVCGHAHGPGREHLERDGGWAAMAGVVASIGLRPCTGAILVLLLAEALDLRWAGFAGAMSMAAGTALTVSTMAALTVHARSLAVGMIDRMSALDPFRARHLLVLARLPMLIGGLAITALGASLAWAVLSAPAHPLF